jgi:hypothetical protein
MAWLCAEFKTSVSTSPSRQSQLACEMAVVRLHDAWARFCRELVILSAYGNIVTLGGMSLTCSRPDIDSLASVIPILLKLKRAKWEPRWASSAACIDAAQNLTIQNLTNVAAALGATNSPAEALRCVRNFYVHRGKDTSELAFDTGYFKFKNQPVVFDLNAYTTGGVTVIESWVEGFEAVAFASVQ